MTRTPRRLKKDAIVDAVFELRFECRETREAPELVVGFLAGNEAWKGYERNRTPAAEIPEQIRQSDPALKAQAVLQLRDPHSTHRLSIGPHVISTGREGGYPGWETMLNDIGALTRFVYGALEDVTITRIGMRYINVFLDAAHHISSVHDLKLKISIDGDHLLSGLNLNFTRETDIAQHIVRIASPEFVLNLRPPDGTALVDIDSVALEPSRMREAQDVTEWANEAHREEKSIFFGLIPESTLSSIVEEWE